MVTEHQEMMDLPVTGLFSYHSQPAGDDGSRVSSMPWRSSRRSRALRRGAAIVQPRDALDQLSMTIA
jgi:hypothetical protein